MKFRKKPVVIEAIQYVNTPEGSNAVLRFCNGVEPIAMWYFDDDRITIETKEGRMNARPGDWIIKGIAGEFYPCAPEIFEASYEEVIE